VAEGDGGKVGVEDEARRAPPHQPAQQRALAVIVTRRLLDFRALSRGEQAEEEMPLAEGRVPRVRAHRPAQLVRAIGGERHGQR